MNLFNAYRKMFASLDDEPVVWWYCGVVMSHRDGVGVVPLTQAETIMVYRTRDVAPDTFTVDWTEVGYFRDINTGEVMSGGWFNPFSVATEPYPKSFVDGPATFTVRRVDHDGIDVQLVQNHARIDRVELAASLNASSIGLVQTETKTRTYHRPDGTLPDLDSPEATAIQTVLSIWSDRAAVDDPARRNVASHGFYSSGSGKASSGAGGSWAKTQVQGTMFKAGPEQRVNPVAWQRLQAFYPAFFKGDRIAPDWD